MATTKLVMTFRDNEGTNRNWSLNYAKSGVTESLVKSLMDGMITNGSIFEHPPIAKVGAKIVVTNETELVVD